jgi:hypothetical protein
LQQLAIHKDQIPWARTKAVVPEPYTINRIKQRVTKDIIQLLQDRLSEQVRLDIEELVSLIDIQELVSLTTDTDRETARLGIDH